MAEFLYEVWIPCDDCRGRGYSPTVCCVCFGSGGGCVLMTEAEAIEFGVSRKELDELKVRQ